MLIRAGQQRSLNLGQMLAAQIQFATADHFFAEQNRIGPTGLWPPRHLIDGGPDELASLLLGIGPPGLMAADLRIAGPRMHGWPVGVTKRAQRDLGFGGHGSRMPAPSDTAPATRVLLPEVVGHFPLVAQPASYRV